MPFRLRSFRALLVALVLSLVVLAMSPLALASLSLQGLNKPARVTVATTWNQLDLPAGADYVRLRPISITGYYGVGCTDGGALGSHYATLTADQVEYISVHASGTVCLAGSGSGTVEVIPMVRGR